MRAIFSYLSALMLLSIIFTSCTQEVEKLNPDPLTDYLPLQTGKYIIYRLDSLVFTQSGTKQEIHSYQEKNLIDQPFTDNSGRNGYIVYRFLRDTAGSEPWKPADTYYVVYSRNDSNLIKSIEIVEDNLRFVRLSAPILENNPWKGNGFLPNDPYGSKYEFFYSFHKDLDEWDFTYSKKDETITLNNKTINNVVTITGPDEATPEDPNNPYNRTFFVQQYAKNLGLVYHEMIMWDYQPANGSRSAYKVGFGVKRSMIDHN